MLIMNLATDMKSTLVISCTMVTTSILAPILFYLWHALGTANANFYFGMTLGFNVAQVSNAEIRFSIHINWNLFFFQNRYFW